MKQRWFQNLSHTRVIALSFLVVILSGTVLLTLPIASKSGEWGNVIDSLFTATSATCVTGLIVADTFTHWTVFGQLVILVMIQIGGIGLMTFITMGFLFTKKKIGVDRRVLLMQSTGNMKLNGIIRMSKKIIGGTMLFEAMGAVVLFFRFLPTMGFGQALYYAIFHSISAFCNAGFDLMGRYEPYSSLTAYETDPVVSITIMALIICGGIGFLVWDDILKNRLHWKNYSLHSKIVLLTTAFLLVSGTIGFFIFEADGNLAPLSLPEKLLSATFMSTTTRTAGFNTMDLSTLSESGNLLAVVLMLIGGSPGSTAGGIKTSTIAIMFIAMISMSHGHHDVTIFKKRLETDLVKQAAVIILIYLTGVMLSSMLICHADGLAISDVLFETASAAGTVGLSRGITPSLSTFSHIILIILMFGGRIGGLSLIMVFGERKAQAPIKRPSEKILIG